MGYGVWCCADGHRQRSSYSSIISCIKQVEVEAVAVIDDGMGIDFFHIKESVRLYRWPPFLYIYDHAIS